MSLFDAPSSARARIPVGVLGAGRLGSALAGALAAAGYNSIRLASRDGARTQRVAAALEVTACSPAELIDACALAFLAVPDGAIGPVAGSLPWRVGQGVVHASGALGLDVLAPATSRGAIAGGLHPLQTFPGTTDRAACAALLRGVTCGLEAPGPLDELLVGMVADLGGRIVRLEGVDRARYHAAAVLVSNDVAALMAAGTRTWTLAGLPEQDAREALAPLLLAAAANVARLPLAEALTGPVARGDTATVARHLAALDAAPDLARAYRALGRELLRLDLGHSADVRTALHALLAEPNA